MLPVINAIKRDSAFNHQSHENGSTIDVFPNFVGANINQRTEWKWQALWHNFSLILIEFHPQMINSRLLRTHSLGNLVRRHHKDLLN